MLYILKSNVVVCSLVYSLANINMIFVLTAGASQTCSRDFPGGPWLSPFESDAGGVVLIPGQGTMIPHPHGTAACPQML